ncbi:MAG: glycosyltransferase [bacterium]
MKILLLAFGKGIPGEFVYIPSRYPENFVKDIPGYEIVTFGYNEGVDIRIDLDDDFEEVIKRLPDGWLPDYCVLYDMLFNMLPRGIENAPFPTVGVICDPDWDIPFIKTNVQSVDFVIVGSEEGKRNLEALGANNVAVYHDTGVMVEFFPVAPKKIKDRNYDIFYSGKIEDGTIKGIAHTRWFLKLCDLAEKYEYNILISPPIPDYKKYLEILQDSKLVFSHVRNGILSSRVLDAGSQGTVVLETGDQIRKYFVPHKEYIPVSEDDFSDQVQKYLQNEHTLQEMSDRFHQKVKKEFESRKHFVKLIELADRALNSKKIDRKLSTLHEIEKIMRRGEVYYFSYHRTGTDGHFPEQGTKFLTLSIEKFKKVMATEPSPRAMLNLAVATTSLSVTISDHSLSRNKINEAISMLNTLVETYPSFAVGYFTLGLLHLKMDNKKEALKVFRIALDLFLDKNSMIDQWCLHSREDLAYSWAYHLGSSLDANMLLLSRGEEDKANKNTRNLYRAATLYYICLLENAKGHIYESIEALIESQKLSLYPEEYPEIGKVAFWAADGLALLGLKTEALNMYKKAMSLLPLNIPLRTQFIKFLHVYRMDEEAIVEIKDAFKIAKTVRALSGYVIELKYLIESFGTKNSGTWYYDICRETTLDGWQHKLHEFLSKKPADIRLLRRIIEILQELGRIDRIFEIVENYISRYLEKTDIDNATIFFLNSIYISLRKMCNTRTRAFHQKLNRFKELIGNLESNTKEIEESGVEILTEIGNDGD